MSVSSGRTEVCSDGSYQYQLSAYEALCDVRVQFAVLADCMIPLYCFFLLFPLKPSNLLFPREGQGLFLHPITSQKGIRSGTTIFTQMLIITTVLFFYEQSFSLLLLLKHYPCCLLCIVKSQCIYDIFPDNSSLYAQEKVF